MNTEPGYLIFHLLELLDVAFVRRSRRLSWWPTADACSGIPSRSHMGEPEWMYTWKEVNDRPSDVSYIRLLPILLPDFTEVDWLGVGGLKDLVWGGGKWFANNAGYSQAISGLVPERRQHGLPAPQISNSKSVLIGGTFYAT